MAMAPETRILPKTRFVYYNYWYELSGRSYQMVYEELELEVIIFEDRDTITTSNCDTKTPDECIVV